MAIIEKITMKKTLLGGGKIGYPARKSYRPPFDPEFTRDILPMVVSKKYPKYFDVMYGRVEDPVDPVETSPEVEVEIDLEAEAARLNAEVGMKNKQKGKK